MEVEKKNTVDGVFHVCMLQLSIKYGINRFSKKGEEDAKKGMQQIHEISTFKSICAKDL